VKDRCDSGWSPKIPLPNRRQDFSGPRRARAKGTRIALNSGRPNGRFFLFFLFSSLITTGEEVGCFFDLRGGLHAERVPGSSFPRELVRRVRTTSAAGSFGFVRSRKTRPLSAGARVSDPNPGRTFRYFSTNQGCGASLRSLLERGARRIWAHGQRVPVDVEVDVRRVGGARSRGEGLLRPGPDVTGVGHPRAGAWPRFLALALRFRCRLPHRSRANDQPAARARRREARTVRSPRTRNRA